MFGMNFLGYGGWSLTSKDGLEIEYCPWWGKKLEEVTNAYGIIRGGHTCALNTAVGAFAPSNNASVKDLG